MLAEQVEFQAEVKNFDLYLYYRDVEKFSIEKHKIYNLKTIRLKPDFEGYIKLIKADATQGRLGPGDIVIAGMHIRWQKDNSFGETLEIEWGDVEIEQSELIYLIGEFIETERLRRDIKVKASPNTTEIFYAQYKKAINSEKWKLILLNTQQ